MLSLKQVWKGVDALLKLPAKSWTQDPKHPLLLDALTGILCIVCALKNSVPGWSQPGGC